MNKLRFRTLNLGFIRIGTQVITNRVLSSGLVKCLVDSHKPKVSTLKIPQNYTTIKGQMIIGYSHGLISSWMAFPQYGVVFDAGDGVASALAGSLGTYTHVFLTHSHMDHVAGLGMFVNLKKRLVPKGITIVGYPSPDCDCRVQSQMAMLGKQVNSSVTHRPCVMNPELPGLQPGSVFDIGGRRQVRAFATKHLKYGDGLYSSCGWLMTCKRKRVLPEFRDLPQEEIQKAARSGTVVDEVFDHPLVAYVGDSPPLAAEQLEILKGVDLLVMESTLLTGDVVDDRERQTHSYTSETLEAARVIRPQALVLNHVSPRHTEAFATNRIEFAIKETFQDPCPPTQVWRLIGNRFCQLR